MILNLKNVEMTDTDAQLEQLKRLWGLCQTQDDQKHSLVKVRQQSPNKVAEIHKLTPKP